MSTASARWLDSAMLSNAQFRARIQPAALPTKRTPGSVAVLTCMDPRVNLEAIGLPGFAPDGSCDSPVRVIRTIGAIAEPRSLLVGLFLAGIREIAVLMHTDCGCCAAFSQIDTIVARMQQNLDPDALGRFRASIGEPFAERLRDWLGAFPDPYLAVRQEVAAIARLPFAPPQLLIHGLVYDLASGRVDVVVNGYDSRACSAPAADQSSASSSSASSAR